MPINASMSIFNKYTDPVTKAVTFKKHLIKNVFWDDSKGVNLNHGYDKADSVNVYVPKSINDLSGYVESKKYNGSGWTIAEGDYIIRGDTDQSEVIGIKDLSNYEVFIITVVDDKDFGSKDLHHFEIKGR